MNLRTSLKSTERHIRVNVMHVRALAAKQACLRITPQSQATLPCSCLVSLHGVDNWNIVLWVVGFEAGLVGT